MDKLSNAAVGLLKAQGWNPPNQELLQFKFSDSCDRYLSDTDKVVPPLFMMRAIPHHPTAKKYIHMDVLESLPLQVEYERAYYDLREICWVYLPRDKE